MIIIGIDPGLVTGLFWIDLATGVPVHRELKSTAFGDELQGCMWMRSDVLVGCEKYIITSHGAKSNQPEALEQTGVAKYLCGKKEIPVHLIIKANALKIANNDRLRAAGWWGKGFTHGNDAARVAMACLAAQYPRVFGALPGVVQL